MSPLVTDTGIDLHPDVTRVVTRLFVAGREDVGPGDSRATPVLRRVLDLDEEAVKAAVRDLDDRFGTRHRNLHATFLEHAAMVTDRAEGTTDMSEDRCLLLGATFTHEYAIEGAALCNPSAVPFPSATDDPATTGVMPFVMSVRGVGEGHRSSIGFRSGTVTREGKVTLDPADPFPVLATTSPSMHRRSVFHAKLGEHDDDRENAALVLDSLSDTFDDAELAAGVAALMADAATRRDVAGTIDNLRHVASSAYQAAFPVDATLSERVLWPHSPAEHHGMEDARFVRFTHDDGSTVHYATYTAFDGVNIAQHLLETDDFRSFAVSPLAGPAAQGKGLALFPRKVGGRYLALSRSDRETNSIAFSDDMRCWSEGEQIQAPSLTWDLLQLGNCGSPIETDEGWLVLTHGVGPMRTYALGVLLLDLDDPERVIARSSQPIVTPAAERRDGYVPNVVYSCGGFAFGDVLVLPYGIADQTIAIATLSVRDLLSSLTPDAVLQR